MLTIDLVDYPQDVRYKGSPCTKYMGYVFLYMMQRSLLMSLSSLPITFVDAIYPVGAIFQTTSDVNPNDYFGVGVWEKIENAFLYGSGTKIAKSMGGEETHTLTLSEMPSHSHSGSTNSTGGHTHTRGTMNITGNFGCVDAPKCDGAFALASGIYSQNSNGGNNNDHVNFNASRSWTGATSSNGSHTHTVTVDYSGGGAAHNNMPPYYVVHIWHRVS